MKLLEFDCETAPNLVYAWGLWDQNIAINRVVEPGYTLCFAARWRGEKEIIFRSCRDDDMLTTAHALFDQADAVIHYNGVKFDMPVMNREFLMNKMMPPAPYKNIDLYRVVRQKFKFESNKLDYVSQQLGLGAKLEHKGMELWRDCMAGDAKAWLLMKKYNIQDVKLLGPLYERLLPWIDQHPNFALYLDEDKLACPNCGSSKVQRRGYQKSRTQIYRRYACQKCGRWSQGNKRVVTMSHEILK